MAIDPELKDSKNYQLIAGLDQDNEAQGLKFENDRMLVDTGENYWKDKRFEYSSGDLIYKGVNVTHKAATDAATWYIWKYTWDGDDCTRIEGPLEGTWDNRASLAWD